MVDPEQVEQRRLEVMDVDQVPGAELKARVEAQLNAAREVYRKIGN